MSDNPAEFFANELRTVLDDQSFGIQSFSITSITPYQALASVRLLEGNIITIKLTIKGYTIEPVESLPQDLAEDPAFDSIEDLLHSTSPLYEGKRHEAWVGKLEQLLSTAR
ncbi:hypothetical protein C0991_004485 [Blastosporella zonata]|nr:hypothetical protein C0991_004485 [Blastosporella zonata]